MPMLLAGIMPEMPGHNLALLLPLLDSLGKELNCALLGKDPSVVSVHFWLNQIEGQSVALHPPQAISTAIQAARHWLDQSFQGDDENAGKDAPSAALAPPVNKDLWPKLASWTQWMRQAVKAAAQGTLLPEFPAQFHRRANAPLCRSFASEASDLLECIESGALAWAANSSDPEALNALLRPLHTLKGAAGLLNLTPIAELSHQLESLLASDAPALPSAKAPIFDLLLDAHSLLRQFVGELEGADWTGDFSEPLRQTAQALRDRMKQLTTSKSAVRPASGAATLVSTSRHGAPDAQGDAEGVAPGDGGTSATSAMPFMRVEGRKFEAFLELFGRWQEAHTELARLRWTTPIPHQALFRSISHVYELSQELQGALLSLRRTSLHRTFEKVEWLLHTLAPTCGKQVRLETEGRDVEVDTETAGALDVILLHLARNALTHGIEAPAVRRASGKPECGTVRLAAQAYDEAVVIELRDDGAGLDHERIATAALERGLTPPGKTLTRKELLDLIFLPGFSTAETMTEVSGRGMGLDVVKRAIEKLDGVLELESTPGLGATFQIYLTQSTRGLEPASGAELGAARNRGTLQGMDVRAALSDQPFSHHVDLKP
jgi:two-component system, chemotaxis family, sensor kinase CheA